MIQKQQQLWMEGTLLKHHARYLRRTNLLKEKALRGERVTDADADDVLDLFAAWCEAHARLAARFPKSPNLHTSAPTPAFGPLWFRELAHTDLAFHGTIR